MSDRGVPSANHDQSRSRNRARQRGRGWHRFECCRTRGGTSVRGCASSGAGHVGVNRPRQSGFFHGQRHRSWPDRPPTDLREAGRHIPR